MARLQRRRTRVVLWAVVIGGRTLGCGPTSDKPLGVSDDAGDKDSGAVDDEDGPAGGEDSGMVLDPWPDDGTADSPGVSLVFQGAVVAPGQEVRVVTGPAGIDQNTELRFILTNRTGEALDLPSDSGAWLDGVGFVWVSGPPASLGVDESADLVWTVNGLEAVAAELRRAILTVPVGESPLMVEIVAEVPRPLRLVVTGSNGLTLVSDTYGADYFIEDAPVGDLRTARDVVWGEGRFFRADRGGQDWADPGVYQWSEDGVTWVDSAAAEEFWASECAYAWDAFYCVRSSNWTSSESGETVLHNAGYWGSLINSVVFAPEATLASTGAVPGDRFVAVGRDGRRALSTDGLSWGPESSFADGDYFNAVAVGAGLVVAVGGSDRMVASVSADGGETWSDTAWCDARYAYLSRVVFGGGWFLASGNNNTCAELWRSPDGLSWEALDGSYHVLDWVNGWFIGYQQPWGYPAVMARSVDGVEWTDVHTVADGFVPVAATSERLGER